MLIIPFICLIFQFGAGAEVNLKVEAENEDDYTSIYSFKCSVVDYEDAQITVISISRQTSSTGDVRDAPPEVIASITGLIPDTPFKGPGFEGATVEGHIDLESDEESFLEVVLSNLRVEDLGLYTCEVAFVDENGKVTVSTAEAGVVSRTSSYVSPDLQRNSVFAAPYAESAAESTTVTPEEIPFIEEKTTASPEESTAIVEETTPQPVETTVPEEDTTVVPEKTTVTEEDTTVVPEETTVTEEATTVVPEETTVTEEATTVVPEETTVTEEDTTVVPEETTVELEETTSVLEETTFTPQDTTVEPTETTVILEETTTVPEETTAAPETGLDTIAGVVESLTNKLIEFNETVVQLEDRLASLEDKAEETNETVSEPAESDVISNYFVYENASYFFFKANQPSDVNRIQAECESRRLYLTEVNDAGELQAIVNEISPYIIPEDLVVVGGQRNLGQDVWLYQGSQGQVDYFAWGPGEPALTADSECLALRSSEGGVEMVTVPCSTNRVNFYFLCEHDE